MTAIGSPAAQTVLGVMWAWIWGVPAFIVSLTL